MFYPTTVFFVMDILLLPYTVYIQIRTKRSAHKTVTDQQLAGLSVVESTTVHEEIECRRRTAANNGVPDSPGSTIRVEFRLV